MASQPEAAGFSSKRLETTRAVLKADVDAKRFPGAVLLMARNGRIAFYDAVGYQDRAAETPMKKDSIFRVASMSKPITTVAAIWRGGSRTEAADDCSGPDASHLGADLRFVRKLASRPDVQKGEYL
jgi:hypothetical protein